MALLVGILLVIMGGGLVEALLYEVPPRHPVFLMAIALVFLATAWVATELPARRAMRVDPATILTD